MIPSRAAAAVLVVALSVGGVVAGCAAGNGAPPTGPVATTQVDLPPSYRFAPEAITVAAGASVTWTNHDHFTHTVQLLDGGMSGDPHEMKPGATTTIAFPTAGTFRYQCSLHPQDMRGTVVVTG
jgi:plastocyanin